MLSGVEQRPADGYLIDGRSPSLAFAPASVDDLARCLAAISEAGLSAAPWGGGTQIGLGNLPEALDIVLDTRRLQDLVRFEPGDLTVGVQAGCTLSELNSRLAEHGQMLPVDAADPERATIGGLVAAGLSGPRRYGYGALRDLIIGITVVLPDGRIAKGGGNVVKNVTGFDMMRLYHGSLGALAVIVQVNFKLVPRPLSERTVVGSYVDFASLAVAAEQVRLSQLGPTAIVALDPGASGGVGVASDRWSLLLRCEAPPVAVARQAERLAELIGRGAGEVAILDAQATPALWQHAARWLSAAASESECNVRIGAQPSQLGSRLAEIDRALERCELEGTQMIDFGAGLVYIRYGRPGATQSRLQATWKVLSGLGSHAALLSAPAEVKQGIDVFGPEPAGLEVMRALKAQFDPARVLNRGRFVGHL